MKNTFLKTIGWAATAILMVAFSAQIQVFAQDNGNGQTQGNPSGKSGDERIVGTWDVQVTIRNCSNGAAIRTFPSVGTFASGGTALDSTSGIPQALKTPGQGVWSHVGGNTFRFSFKSFSFGTNNFLTGWTIIRHEAILNADENSYTSAGTAEVFGPHGVLLFTGCATTTATRFE
jgi:hypothetical protein